MANKEYELVVCFLCDDCFEYLLNNSTKRIERWAGESDKECSVCGKESPNRAVHVDKKEYFDIFKNENIYYQHLKGMFDLEPQKET